MTRILAAVLILISAGHTNAETAAPQKIRITANGFERPYNFDIGKPTTMGCLDPYRTAQWLTLITGDKRQQIRGTRTETVIDRNDTAWFKMDTFRRSLVGQCSSLEVGSVLTVNATDKRYGVDMICVSAPNDRQFRTWYGANDCLWIVAADASPAQ